MLRKILDFLRNKCRWDRDCLSGEEKLRSDMTARNR